jgi:ribosomal protein L32
MKCPHCGDMKRTHVICQTCGYYAGKHVSERVGYVEHNHG